MSGIPFNGPIGAARVGYIDGQYVLNPTRTQLQEQSRLDLVVAGTENAVLMVESEANVLSEDEMLGAVMFGHEALQAVIRTARELGREAGKPRWDWQPPEKDTSLAGTVAGLSGERIAGAFRISDKVERQNAVAEVKEALLEELCPEGTAEDVRSAVLDEFKKLQKNVVRSQILDGNPRIDGRDTRTVRPHQHRDRCASENPRFRQVHAAGETQAIVVATLGTERDAQIIDALDGEYRDNFMLHYNFPPYCVGETGRVGQPEAPRDRSRTAGQARHSRRGSPTRKSFRTRSGSSPKSPSPTVPVPWPVSAAPAWR